MSLNLPEGQYRETLYDIYGLGYRLQVFVPFAQTKAGHDEMGCVMPMCGTANHISLAVTPNRARGFAAPDSVLVSFFVGYWGTDQFPLLVANFCTR